MNGLMASGKQVLQRDKAHDPEERADRDRSRVKLRDFILSVLDPKPSNKVVWSIPPVYPFDDEDHRENSGFVF